MTRLPRLSAGLLKPILDTACFFSLKRIHSRLRDGSMRRARFGLMG